MTGFQVCNDYEVGRYEVFKKVVNDPHSWSFKYPEEAKPNPITGGMPIKLEMLMKSCNWLNILGSNHGSDYAFLIIPDGNVGMADGILDDINYRLSDCLANVYFPIYSTKDVIKNLPDNFTSIRGAIDAWYDSWNMNKPKEIKLTAVSKVKPENADSRTILSDEELKIEIDRLISLKENEG